MVLVSSVPVRSTTGCRRCAWCEAQNMNSAESGGVWSAQSRRRFCTRLYNRSASSRVSSRTRTNAQEQRPLTEAAGNDAMSRSPPPIPGASLPSQKSPRARAVHARRQLHHAFCSTRFPTQRRQPFAVVCMDLKHLSMTTRSPFGRGEIRNPYANNGATDHQTDTGPQVPSRTRDGTAVAWHAGRSSTSGV